MLKDRRTSVQTAKLTRELGLSKNKGEIQDSGMTRFLSNTGATRSRRVSRSSMTSESNLKGRARVPTLKGLSSFIPHTLLKLILPGDIAEEVSVDKTARVETYNAAMMLADISGFSRLSEKLYAKGKAGVDELSRTINGVFGELIESITEFQGDIINFAGDALLVMWRNIDLLQSAVSCGLHLARFDNYGLSVHVGISSGTMHYCIVGGYNDIWCGLCVGEPLSDMAKAEATAIAGDVVLCRKTFEAVKDSCVSFEILGEGENVLVTKVLTVFTRTKRSFRYMDNNKRSARSIAGSSSINGSILTAHHPDTDFFSRWLEAKSDDGSLERLMSVLSTFIPKPAIDAALHNHDTMNEFRTVTVLFMKLDGVLDVFKKPGDDLEQNLLKRIQPPLKDFQECLESYNGMLRQFMIDDKGCVFIAGFGVPHFTSDHNAFAALRCAIMFANIAKKHNLVPSVGVTTGSMFCGTVGTRQRREYAIVGKKS